MPAADPEPKPGWAQLAVASAAICGTGLPRSGAVQLLEDQLADRFASWIKVAMHPD